MQQLNGIIDNTLGVRPLVIGTWCYILMVQNGFQIAVHCSDHDVSQGYNGPNIYKTF